MRNWILRWPTSMDSNDCGSSTFFIGLSPLNPGSSLIAMSESMVCSPHGRRADRIPLVSR